MRIIAFITFSADIHKILEHIGVDPDVPRITPARGPPLWEGEGASESQEQGEGVEAEPDWDLANQSPPDYPDDQLIQRAPLNQSLNRVAENLQLRVRDALRARPCLHAAQATAHRLQYGLINRHRGSHRRYQHVQRSRGASRAAGLSSAPC